MRAEEFFSFARERHAIFMRRVFGDPEPWTDDPILAMYRFTNVFRELDRTTIWFRQHVRDRLADRPPFEQVLGTILFRTLNRIESGEVLFCQGRLFEEEGHPPGWWYVGRADNNPEVDWLGYLERPLRSALPRGPWVTGSYIVKTPDGMDKLRGALWIVEEARRRIPDALLAWVPESGLQGLWRALLDFPYYGGGGFMAYEVVSDLRWLPIGRDAHDIMTWANAGPGAKRGINRLLGRDRDTPLLPVFCLQTMRDLLALSQDAHYWPRDWRQWEMREVEHTLCEWDKYERVRLGEGRPRGRFR